MPPVVRGRCGCSAFDCGKGFTGLQFGPLCPIYGAGAVGAVVVLGQVHNPLVVFLLSMVGASILEYVTSWVMEALFHARWWDYSDYKFNLNGRICLLGAFVFGVGGVLITSVIQPQVAGVTDRLPLPAIHWLCGVLFVLTLRSVRSFGNEAIIRRC